MQPVHCCHVAAGRLVHVGVGDDVARRRTGRRAAARGRPRGSTCGLSPERLITQLEMITSTESSGSGIVLDLALEELDVLDARLTLVLAGELEHLVGHVEAVGLAGRADAPGREQHVDAAARAEVEHGLALVEVGDRGRVAAAERRELRRVRQRLAVLALRRGRSRRRRAARR